MKIEYILLAVLIVVTAIIAATIGYAVRNTERASSFVGDTVRLDVSRLED